MSQTLIVGEVEMEGFKLSVTTRDAGDTTRDPRLNWQHLSEITYRTGVVWKIIADKLQQDDFIMAGGSVEDEYAAALNNPKDPDSPRPDPPIEFPETFGEPRATVWNMRDWKSKDTHQFSFHLNSDDVPQVAIDTWLANQRATQRLAEKFPQKPLQSRQDASPANATPQTGSERPATPKNAPKAEFPNAQEMEALMTKKEAIAHLEPGSIFKMKIVQIEKHSKDGKDFYDFYEPYGGKAGQYSAKTVYADNEVALNSGLIAHLETMGIQLGQALTGNWIVNAVVGKPKTKTIKGEEKTFTDIYINSFEGQGIPA